MTNQSDPRIPDKSFFQIGEVADIVDVETHVLRFWESEFSLLAPKKSRTGTRRIYSRDDVALVLRIRDLLYDKQYTISGARKVLNKKSEDLPNDLWTKPRIKGLTTKINQEIEELLNIVKDSHR